MSFLGISFKRKPGGSFFGNLLRSVIRSASYGVIDLHAPGYGGAAPEEDMPGI